MTNQQKQIEELWNQQPFLEKLLFLMNKLKISENEANELAKLKFEKMAIAYKYQIYLFLDQKQKIGVRLFNAHLKIKNYEKPTRTIKA